jgi:hypothetical protein
MPTLSLLRVDPPAPEKPVADVLGIATPDIAVAPAEQALEAVPTEPEKLAALKPEEPVSAESATADAPAAVAEMPAAPTDTPVVEPEVKVAAITETPATPAPSPAERPSDVLRLDDNAATTRIAALGSPAVILDPTDAKPDRSVRKRSAQRTRERRRLAARRARLAREALAAQQRIHQENNPFAPALLGRPTR